MRIDRCLTKVCAIVDIEVGEENEKKKEEVTNEFLKIFLTASNSGWMIQDDLDPPLVIERLELQ